MIQYRVVLTHKLHQQRIKFTVASALYHRLIILGKGSQRFHRTQEYCHQSGQDPRKVGFLP